MQSVINFLMYLWAQVVPYITPANFALVVGAVMPLVIQVINQYVPDSSKYRSAVSWAVSGLIGTLSVIIAGQFNPQTLVSSIALVYSASQISYRYWFKGSNIEKTINARFKN